MSTPTLHVDIGREVALVGLEEDIALEGRTGTVLDVDGVDCIVAVGDQLGVVSQDKVGPTPCSACGVDAGGEHAQVRRLTTERNALHNDVIHLRRIAEAHAADSAALRDELSRVNSELSATHAAANRRTEHLEAAMRAAVAQQIGSFTSEIDAATTTHSDTALSAQQERTRLAEADAAKANAALAAVYDSARQALLEARALFENVCEAFSAQEDFSAGYAQIGEGGNTLQSPTQNDEPEFVVRVQRKRLDRSAAALSSALRGVDSCHDWIAQAVEATGQPRPGALPAAPLHHFPNYSDPELLGDEPKPTVTFAEEDKKEEPKEEDDLEALRSTSKQRYMGTPKENKPHPYRGKTHLLSICLDYAGTQSPLNCCVDGDRVTGVAKKGGVQDIVKLYDIDAPDGPTWPSRANVLGTIASMGARCAPGDYFVLHYSGHGGSVEDLDGDEETGFDQTLCLRHPSGEIDQLVDDDFSAALATCCGSDVSILVLADACHSGTLLDLAKDDLWGSHKNVVSISGCQDAQCSTDTGDGGAMTNAFLKIMKSKLTRDLRKKRKCSIQYVFNRMVEAIKQPDEVKYDDSDGSEWSETAPPEDDNESSTDYQDLLMAAIYGIEIGQDMTLSWISQCDPTTVCFPF